MARMHQTSKLPKVFAAVAAAVVVLLLVATLVADGIATRKAQEQAALWSQKLGRKIEVGSISTTVFTGLGAKISALSVGPADGQAGDVALLKLARAEIKIAALKALFSLGKDVEVRSVELADLGVNVVRFPDGTTNLERLQKRLAEVAPQQKEEKPKGETDLSSVRVDHVALTNGRFSFLDLAVKGAKELAVSDLNLTVNDLRAGAPLHVLVTAAVLADKRNFELTLDAAPLPKTLTPTPEHLTLRIAPAIDLAPLSPFLPKSVGLQGGRVDADLDAKLGGAVPGGEGPTAVKGAVHALQLRFAGAGGKPLDVVLDTDVKADAAKGDVQLDKLKLDFGPAGISGQGRATGLNSGAPRIDGLTVTSHGLDPAVLAAYYPPLEKSLKGQAAGPIGLVLHAAGTTGSQQLELKIDLTPVKLAVPETLAKAAGAPMTLIARLQGASNGEQRFEVKADLAGVDLRPGQSVDKAPGDRLDLGLAGLRKSSGQKTHYEVPDLGLHLKDTEFDGKATADQDAGEKKTAFALQLHSARVDLDKLLLETTAKKKEKPPLDPRSFAGLSGTAQVKLDEILYKKQTLKNALLLAKLEEDKLTLEKADVEAFSGKLSAAGTTLLLAHPKAPFHALMTVRGLEMSEAIATQTSRKLLSGKLDATVDLQGAGAEPEALKKSLTGNLNGHLLDGVFYGKDLVAAVTGPLAKSLPFGLLGKTGAGGQTSLGKDLPVSITFANGEARLGKPISLTTPEAAIMLTGGISLDGKLDMPGTVTLQPATVSQLTGGKASVKDPVPVKLRLVGPVTSPEVTDLDLKDAAATIAKGAAAGLLGKVLGGSGQGDAEAKARAAAQKQEETVKKQAEDAAKKAADQAAGQLKGLFGH